MAGRQHWFQRPWLKVMVVSMIVLALSHLVVLIISRINILDSLGKSTADFDFTDLYYSVIKKSARWERPDTTITIINIGYLSRKDIARVIVAVNEHQPNVLGLGIIFSALRDSLGDAMLSDAIAQSKTCVMTSRLHSETNFPPFDSVERSYYKFLKNTVQGYANINIPEDDKDYGTVRDFIYSYEVRNRKQWPFAYQIVKHHDSLKLLHNVENGSLEPINFFGYANKPWLDEGASINTFASLDYNEVLTDNFDPSLIRNKIVLLGYLGDVNNLGYESRFYTPLNERYAGRSMPDMFGIEIHANMIKMMLEERYIWNSAVLNTILSLAFLLFSVWACNKVHRKFPTQFQLLSTAIIFILINIMIFIPLIIFIEEEIKIDLRRGVFYLLFVPTFYEIIDINLFQRLEGSSLK
ncbi:MAG: CHASE2 domain-containing protein [Bacteroidota bacterium]